MQKFNGSLIRQFPSLVSGNAATGVQVTVKIAGGNTLATLYATNNIAGATKSNPTTTDTKGFYSFYAADGKYVLEFNNGFPSLDVQLVDVDAIRSEFDALEASNTTFRNEQQASYGALEASNAAFRNEQQAAYDAFVLSQGWDQVGTFVDGFTFESPNQVGQDADGNWWRWNGALPKTVTAGALPSSDTDYKLVGDGVLRSDLANPDKGAAMVGRGVVAVDSIADLLALPEGQRKEGLRYLVKGYHAGSSVGGGPFAYRAGGDFTHDGGNFIAASAPFPPDWTDEAQVDAWFSAASSGAFFERARADMEHLVAEDFGVRAGNNEILEKANELILMKKLLPASSSGRGIIKVGEGNYDFGDIRFAWTNDTWPFGRPKGVRGSGVNRTRIFTSTPPGQKVFDATGSVYWLVFEDFTVQPKLWWGNSGNEYRSLEYNADFLNPTGTIPRLKAHRLHILGYRHSFNVNTWISEVSQIEVSSCIYGPILNGTTTSCSDVFAKDCVYGVALGARVHEDNVDGQKGASWRQGSLVYSGVVNCGSERCMKAAYVIGEYSGALSTGAELVYSTGSNTPEGVILFPQYVDEFGAPITEAVTNPKRADIRKFYYWSNITGIGANAGLIQINRNGAAARIGDIDVAGDPSQQKIMGFGTGVTDVDIDIDGSANQVRSETWMIPINLRGVRIRGVWQNAVAYRAKSFAGTKSTADQIFKRFDLDLSNWGGNAALRVALTGTKFSNASSAHISMDVIDYSTNYIDRESFVGRVDVRGYRSPSVSEGNAQIYYRGLNDDVPPFVVSVLPSTQNTGGLDLVIRPTNSLAFSNSRKMARVTIVTAAEFAPNADLKSIAWLE